MDFEKILENADISTIVAAKKCKTPEELAKFAMENGVHIPNEKFEAAFEFMKNYEVESVSELDEDELASIAGGQAKKHSETVNTCGSAPGYFYNS